MRSLYQKALEIKTNNNHTVDDIDDIVRSAILKLNTLYRSGQNKKKTEEKYISKEYKAFITHVRNDDKEFEKLLHRCIINETNISNFIKGNTQRPQHKTKDFFAVYCDCEGYHDFIVKHKNVDYAKDMGTPKSENLIYGATIVNEEFVNSVKSGKPFTMPEFYGAKQNNNCQWYGIINDFDVIRMGYDKLKETVLNSFIEEKDGKVSAIVHGTGGSGKSTLLRRLAVDFYKESFDVVWLEKGKIEEFVEKGLVAMRNEIGKDEKRKFLIVIEDWYRMFDDGHKIRLGVKILEDTHTINNIRIIIGDRNIGKAYKNYRNNGFELQLSSKDNKEIIEKIIEKHPHWKFASQKLFGKVKNYESSLFMLLFVLARTDQKVFKKTTLDFFEPQQAFQNIIESDLKFIANEYIGLAKALYYWGNMYVKKKTLISYETFLSLADFYNEKDTTEIRDFFIRWNSEDEVLDKLKLYIYKNEKGFIQFNHDILADVGLSEIIFENWKQFGTKIKLQLLDVITEKGDDYSACRFLTDMFVYEGQIFENADERIYFIKRLIKNNNRLTYYLTELHWLKIEDNKLKEIARLIWDKKLDAGTFWSDYFEQINDDEILSKDVADILSKSGLLKYNSHFIGVVLRYTKNIEVKNNFINEVVHDSFFEDISVPVDIFSKCFRYCPLEKQISYSEEYLMRGNLNNTSIINTSLVFASNKVRKEFFKNLLVDDKWKALKDFGSVIKCLHLLDKTTMENFFKRVLLDDDYDIIEKFFYQCKKLGSEKFKRMFIKIAAENNDGKHPNLVRDILFVEGIGLGGYLKQ